MSRATTSYPAITAVLLAALMLSACGGEPTATPNASASTQPDTVVTSRSQGKAVPNPRRGSYKKSDPNEQWGYKTPN
jgi:hypothetical protein